jgi:hypothetical protein
LDSARGFGNFIAKIVGPAAISIQVVEMLVELGGKKPGSYIEIFVVVGGEPASVFLSFLNGAAGGGCSIGKL